MTQRSQKGFSLIELVITIVIMGIISIVVGKILVAGYNTFLVAQNISEADWQGLLALEMITNDVHNIRSSAGITTLSSGTFSFVDMSGTTVTYQLSGSLLQRNSLNVANGVSALTLAYLDKNGSVTATASAVRYISVSLTIAQGSLSRVYSTMIGTRGML